MLLESKVYHTNLSSQPALAMSSPRVEEIQEVAVEGPPSSLFIRDMLTFS